jgi:hypothetical protein
MGSIVYLSTDDPEGKCVIFVYIYIYIYTYT